MTENYFKKLNEINVSDKIERKNGLSYLPWADAWTEIKKIHPEANYTIYKNNEGWNYFTDGKTCWVETGVTINNIEHIENLPVMDFKNKSIELEKVTSMDVCKAIQRSLTKACARHGLGLYVYRGEDLPEVIEDEKTIATKNVRLVAEIEECNSESALTDLYVKNKDYITRTKELLDLITRKGTELKAKGVA